MEELLKDVRYSLRGLAKRPAYVAPFVVTLALGIGANTAIFSLVRGVLLRPLPHDGGERIVYLRHEAPLAGARNVLFSVPEIDDYRQHSPSLGGVAELSVLTFTLLGLDEPRRVQAGIVTGNYFDVVGLDPVVGRVLDPEDDAAGATPAVVLTHEYWSKTFGADPGVVGRRVEMNGLTAVVVGVLQPAPAFPEGTDVLVNMAASPHHLSASMSDDRSHRMTEVLARLSPGATLEEAQRDVDQVSDRIHRQFSEHYEAAAGYGVQVSYLRDELTKRARGSLLVLLGVSGFVLLIACANVASLTLVRAVARQRELALRQALGASRLRLRRMLFVESLILALAGGALGLVLAVGGLDLLVALASRYTPRAAEIRIDRVVLLFALTLAAGTALLLAWVPGLPGLPSLRSAALGEGGSGSGSRDFGGVSRRRLQRLLVVAQTATAFVVLVGAGLLLRTLLELRQLDPGFDTDNVLTLEVPPSIRDLDERRRFYGGLLDGVEALPGVTSASLTTTVPLRDEPPTLGGRLELEVEGLAREPGLPMPRAEFRTVSPGYFETVGIPILEGRGFRLSDEPDSSRVVVLNRRAVEAYFQGTAALGRRIAWRGDQVRFAGISTEWRTVVGVVGDSRDYHLDSEPHPVVYHPFAQETPFLDLALVLKTSRPPETLAREVVKLIRERRPQQPIEEIRTLQQIRSQAMSPQRLNSALVGGFGLLALAIVAVGVFGLLSFSVARRRRELGVRLALGAEPQLLVSQVLRQGVLLALAGVALGAFVAFGLTGLLSSLLYGVAPTDVSTFAAVTLLLVTVAAIASWIPAQRAARVDPARALRED